MTAAADTLYLPVPAPKIIRVYPTDMRQQDNARQPQAQPQRQAHRLFRIPSKQVVKGMTYDRNGNVDVERTSGMLIDVFA